MAARVRAGDDDFEITLLNRWRIIVPWSVTILLNNAASEDRQLVDFGLIDLHWPRLDEDLSVRGLLRIFGAHAPPKGGVS